MRPRYSSFLLAIAALPAAAQTMAQATVVDANIQGFAFLPPALTVQTGDVVRWTNLDSAPHTVTETTASTPAGFASGTLSRNGTFSFTFTTPGTYPYQCNIHPSMTGSVTVEGTSAADDGPVALRIDASHPNPFRTSTRFEVTTGRAERVRVSVYDLAGREVTVLHDGLISAATPTPFEWAPGGLPAGTYAVRVEGETFRATRTVAFAR